MTTSQRRRAGFSIFATMAFLSFVLVMSGVLLSSIIERFNLSGASQGLPLTAVSIGSVLALLSSFLVMGRLTKPTLLKLAVGACSLALVGLAIAPDYGAFLAASVALGVCTGYIDTLLSASIADLYRGPSSEKMMSALHTIYGASSMVVPMIYASVLSGLADAGLPWTRLYLCVSVLGVAALTLLALFNRRQKRDDGTVPDGERRLTKALVLDKLRDGILPGLIVSMFFHNLFFSGINTWISRYVSLTLGSALGSAALSSLWLGIMLSRLLFPRLQWKTRSYVSVAGFAACAIMLLALSFSSAILMCVSAALVGLVFGAMLPCALNIGCSVTPENTLLATTSLNLAMNLGAMIGAPLVGAIEGALGMRAAMAIDTGFVAVASLCLTLTFRRHEKKLRQAAA